MAFSSEWKRVRTKRGHFEDFDRENSAERLEGQAALLLSVHLHLKDYEVESRHVFERYNKYHAMAAELRDMRRTLIPAIKETNGVLDA